MSEVINFALNVTGNFSHCLTVVMILQNQLLNLNNFAPSSLFLKYSIGCTKYDNSEFYRFIGLCDKECNELVKQTRSKVKKIKWLLRNKISLTCTKKSIYGIFNIYSDCLIQFNIIFRKINFIQIFV